jgi:alpha-L-fucosidase
MLVDIASKGGNLLLNVGPTAEGLIPEPSVERLKAIGAWMDINSASIYGTDASPFFKLPWGRCTKRESSTGTTLYLHVFNWPDDGVLRVPGIKTKIKSASLLSGSETKLASRFEGSDLLIDLPEVMPNPINTVVVVETKGDLEVTSNMPSLKEGEIELPVDFADIHNPGYGTHIILKGTGENALITNWVDSRARLEWMFNSTEPGIYVAKVMVKAEDPNNVTITVGAQEVVAEVGATDGAFAEISLGEIEISETGNLILSLRPVQEEWTGIELGKLALIKQ